jgi:hypothetical protein
VLAYPIMNMVRSLQVIQNAGNIFSWETVVVLRRNREVDKLPGAHLIGNTSRFWIVSMFIVLLYISLH